MDKIKEAKQHMLMFQKYYSGPKIKDTEILLYSN